MPNSVLEKPIEMFRSDPSRGIDGGRASIDPTGGDQGAGLISRASIVTRGEALGHGLFLDTEFIKHVDDEINKKKTGAKVRFTHPEMSGDGLGSFLGRAKNSVVEGDQVFADIHLSRSSHSTPDGDLGAYVMGLAESDPDVFGLSIVFRRDEEAEAEFTLEHGGEVRNGFIDDSNFESPDEMNENNLPHARLRTLFGADVVDEPAANPDGLFTTGQEIPREADALLAFACGLSDERPTTVALRIDADRASGFVKRFLNNHNLEIRRKPEMSETTTPPESTTPAESTTPPESTTPAESGESTTPPAADAADPGVTDDPATSEPGGAEMSSGGGKAGEGERYLAAFGDAGGVWFAQGLSFEAAQEKYNAAIAEENAKLKGENADLTKRLAAVDRGAKPVPASTGEQNPRAAKLGAALGTNLGRFASGIKLAADPENN